jgi:CheY-like chemotaxis protein
MKRILFVDDEQRVLSGLRRQLHGRRDAWEMQFTDGGPAALAALAAGAAAGGPFDVIVSDMRMPGMDGAQLLARVSREFPHAGRLVLSGHADPDRMQLARSCAHRYLQKPCPPQVLEQEIEAALSAREALDRLRWEAATSVWCSPPNRFEHCSSVFSALASEADTEEVVAGLLTSFVEDTIFWGQLAQLLAAAFPAQVGPLARPQAVVAALGTRTLLSLVMGLRFAEAFGMLPARASAADEQSLARWEAALLVTRHAGAIAACESLGPEILAQAVTASLLTLPLPAAAPAASDAVLADRALVLQWLLPTWGFRDTVAAAAAFRDAPARCPAPLSGPLALLAGADLLVAWSDPASPPGETLLQARLAWLQERGWKEPRERWLAAAAGLPRA